MSGFRRRLMMSQRNSEPVDVSNYLCFTALEAGTFTFTYGTNSAAGRVGNTAHMDYSLDGGATWTVFPITFGASVTTPTVQAGDKVYWRGYHGALGKYNDTMLCPFSSTGRYNISGDVRSILDVSTIGSQYLGGSPYGYVLHSVFAGNMIVSAEDLILPPPNMQQSYDYMFDGCSYMTTPPKEIGLGTGNRCFDGMFRNCTSLTKSPSMYTETLTSYCYNVHFRYCSSLKWIKMLAVTLANGSLNVWVQGVPTTSDGIFIKHIDATWTNTGNSGVPTNWTVIYYDPDDDKYYTDQTKATECDDHGNPI